MRSVCLATAVAFSVFLPFGAFGQTTQQCPAQLSITNYHFVSEERVSLTLSNVTYSADLVNPGGQQASVTAKLTSLNPFSFRTLQGKDVLTFPTPVAANSQVSSTNQIVILVDRTVAFDWKNAQWAFTCVQSPPQANAGPDQETELGKTVTLNGSASTNPSGAGTLTYQWIFDQRPAGSTAILNNPTSVMPTFVADVPNATWIVKLTVSNGVAGVPSSTDTVKITTGIVPPPVACAGPNQTVPISSLVTLNGSCSTSSGGRPLTYAWRLIARPAGSLARLTGETTVSPTFTADKYAPCTNGNDCYVAELIVNDGLSNSGPSQVKISTSCVAPEANAGDNQALKFGNLVQLDGSKSTDACGLPLTYQWNLITRPTSSTATLTNPATVNPTFMPDFIGNYVAQLTVTNSLGLKSDPKTVTIASQPLPPTADAGPNQNVTSGSLVQLNCVGADPNNPQQLPLTYAWTLTTVPTGSKAALSSNTIANPTFTPDLAGNYAAQCVVTNSASMSSQAKTVMISTTCGAPPTADPGSNQTVLLGDTATLDGSKSGDQCNDPITYKWSLLNKPAGSSAALVGATTASPSLTPDVAGPYVVQLIVNNGITDSAPKTVTVTATNRGAITVPANTTLPAVGQCAAFPVNLDVAAPAAGTTVALSSSDPAITITPASVTIAAGAKTPGTQPQVCGANFGSATINASSAFYASASGTVTVPSPTLTFAPATMTINGFVTKDLTLQISVPAPAGFKVNLTSSNASVASVPNSVTFNTGATSVPVTVTGVSAGGPVTITATGGGASATASVTVTAPTLSLSPATLTIKGGATGTLTATLSSALSTPLTVTLVSDKPGVATVQGTITIPANTLSATATVTGVAPGTANITASGPGVESASAKTVVTVPADILLQDGILVPPGGQMQFPVTLTSPAPQNGVFITLTSKDPSKVTLNGGNTTLNLFIPEGKTQSTTVPVVNGVALGTSEISATAQNLTAAKTIVTVGVQSVVLPANTSVQLGGTAAFPISVSKAPASDLIVNLTSDSANVTISPASVTIPAGQTTPATQPQVFGAGIGSATITGAASNYTSGTGSVTVTAPTLSLAPPNITVVAGIPAGGFFVLNMANGKAPAPNGFVVNLGATGPVTVPATVTIPAGQTSVNVPVTGTAEGTAIVTASAPGVAQPASGGVTIIQQMIMVPQNTQVQLGFSAPLAITAAPAPSADLLVTLSSSDPKVTISPTTVTIPAGQTQPAVQPQVTGAGIGTATITASAPGGSGYAAGTGTVTVPAPTVAFVGPVTVKGGNPANLTLTMTGGKGPAGGFSLTLTSDNPAVAGGTATFAAGSTTASASLTTTPVSTDQIANITANGVAGIIPATTTVTVTSKGVMDVSAVTVGTNQTGTVTVTLPDPAPASPVTVTLTSSNTGVATVTPTITIPAGSKTGTATVTGVSGGTANISAAASGYSQGTGTATVTPLGLKIDPLTVVAGGQGTLSLSLTGGQAPAAGLTVNLTSNTPGVATVASTATFAPNATSTTAAVNGVAEGSATITGTSTTPSLNAQGTVTVTKRPTITVTPVSVGLGMTGNLQVTVSPAPTSDLAISFTTSSAANVPAPAGITIPANSTTGTATVTGEGIGAADITGSGTGYDSGTGKVTVTAPTATFAGPVTVTGGGNATLTLNLTGGKAPTAGLTFNLTSSNAAVSGGTVTFAKGETSKSVQLATTPVSNQVDATITAKSTGIADATTTVTVKTIGDILVSSPTVGTNQTATVTVTLTVAASVPVTVSLASDKTAVATVTPSITIPAGQTSGTATVTGVSGGSATITGTASGYKPGSGTATVTPLVLTAQNLNVRAGKQGTLNLTLSGGQAPAAGLTVNLTSDKTGIATVSPTAAFAGGATTATAIVTGVAEGSATITVSGPGIANTTATVTVTPKPTITLAPISVNLGETKQMTVTLSEVPASNLTVSFTTSNAAKVPAPANITIPAGSPSGTVTVSGDGIGTADITAAATDYQSGTGTVTVTPPTPAFNPTSLTVNPGAKGTLTLNLTNGKAPAGGLTMNLNSSNTAVATVPATATFAAGATSATVEVTGVAGGATQITATGTGFTTQATASVNVPGTITISNVASLPLGNTATMTVTLSLPAPSGGATVSFTSSSPSVVAAPANLTIAQGQTTGTITVEGLGAGAADITGSATGYISGKGTVTVPAPTMAFTPGTLDVMVGSNGTLTLNLTGGKAPTGGLTVNLSSDATSKATVPNNVVFAKGETSKTVTVTGVALGSATITASAPGITNATAAVNVKLPKITLSSPTVNLGLTGTLQVTLETAPTSPVTVSFTSSAPTVVPAPASITIPAGQTQGTAIVTGNYIGESTITGSAANYTSGTGKVTVTVTMTVNPTNTSVVYPGGSTALQLTLVGGQAPTGGLTVNVLSNPTGKVTVPSTVTFAAGATTASIPVTPVALGSTAVTATIPGTVISATSNILVVDCQGCQPMYGPATAPVVGQNLQAQYRFTLGAPATAGGVNVVITSADPSKALVATTPGAVGSQQTTVNVAGTLSVGTFYVQGVANTGTVDIQFSAPGYYPTKTTATLTPSGFLLKCPDDSSSCQTYAGTAAINLKVYPTRLDSSMNPVENQALRGGPNVSVSVTNSNPSAGTAATPATVTGGSLSGTTTFTPTTNNANAGTAIVTAQAPPGFGTPASGNAVSVTVLPANISCQSVTVGKNMETPVTCTLLGDTPTAPVNILITSGNSGLLQFSKTATGVGSGSITVATTCSPFGCQTSTPTFYAYGLGTSGTVNYTAQATGFTNGSATVTLAPSGFAAASPSGINGSFTALGAGSTTTIRAVAVYLDPAQGGKPVETALAGGIAPVTLTVNNSNALAGSISPTQVTISPGSGSASATFTAVNPLPSNPAGETTLITVPTPVGYTSISGQVTGFVPTGNVPLTLQCDGAQIGQNLQQLCTVSTKMQASDLVITLTSNSPGALLLSNTATVAGSGQIQVTIPAGSDRTTYYAQSLASSGIVTHTANAVGYSQATATITLSPSGVVIEGQSGMGPFLNFYYVNLSGGAVPVKVYTAMLNPGNTFNSVQALRGGYGPLSVTVASNNTGVGTIITPVTIPQGNFVGTTTFTPVSLGNTTLSVTQPPGGFVAPPSFPPNSYTSVLVTVQ